MDLEERDRATAVVVATADPREVLAIIPGVKDPIPVAEEAATQAVPVQVALDLGRTAPAAATDQAQALVAVEQVQALGEVD
jgi:hypothetical protein